MCQKRPFDVKAITPRGTLGFCCFHIAQIMTHHAIYTLPFTFQLRYKVLGILQRMINSLKGSYIKSWCILKSINFKVSTLLDISMRFSQRGGRKIGISSYPSLIFLRTIKSRFPEIWDFKYQFKEGAGMKLSFAYQHPLWTFLF